MTSVDFHHLWLTQSSVQTELQQLLATAQENAEKERKAALTIQRVHRGQTLRAIVMQKQLAEVVISRVFRGFLGRRQAMKQLIERETKFRTAFFHYHALRIQACYRGYSSRKYKHDSRARRAYIEGIRRQGDELRTFLAKRLEEQQQQVTESEFTNRKQEFAGLTRNLHHLIGTKTNPGVYGGPVAPTAFGIPLEEHIREEVRAVLTSQPKKVQLHRPTPPKIRASLRASSSYHEEEEIRQQGIRFDRLRRISSKDFNTSCKTHIPAPPYAGSISSGEEYLDAYQNPYFKRGVPRSAEDVDPNHSTLGKYPKVPFYVSGGQQKNKVLPNDLFDP